MEDLTLTPLVLEVEKEETKQSSMRCDATGQKEASKPIDQDTIKVIVIGKK